PSTTDVPPTIPQPLLDHEWTSSAWITVGGPQPISDGKSSLRFDADGRIYVTTPRNTGSGTATIEDGTITIGRVATTRKACIGEELAKAERQFLELLSHPLTWSINDGALTLTPQDVSDSGLILRG
ncbi:MAG: META domain-containing protein, partial [Acidimicrobiia bacterium]|nr:META domain-containing protein [Acidimicrobiia bacterium]